MRNRYDELRARQQKEFDVLHIGYAFSKAQFREMLQEWGLDPEEENSRKTVIHIGAGGYIQEKDIPRLAEVNLRHKREMEEAISEDVSGNGFCYEMFLSEMADRELGYTGEFEDAITGVGLTSEEVAQSKALSHAFEKAKRKIIATSVF